MKKELEWSAFPPPTKSGHWFARHHEPESSLSNDDGYVVEIVYVDATVKEHPLIHSKLGICDYDEGPWEEFAGPIPKPHELKEG